MILRTIFLYFICLVIFSCNGQQNKASYEKISGYTQGTTYHITYKSATNDDLQKLIEEKLIFFDKIFSIYDSSSMVSRINNNDTNVFINHFFYTLYKRSYDIYQSSSGLFDITIGPLVNAWGFGITANKNPSKKSIDSLLQFLGMDKIQIKNNKLIKSDKRIKLDFNAIAQGYAVDFISKYLDSLNIDNYLVEIGGELYAKGVNDKNEKWKIGIEKPIEGNNEQGKYIQAVIEISNKAVSTSGSYRKFYIENGVKYSHTINPKTGYPIKNTLLSVTIVANDCTTADGMATACMVMGVDESIRFLSKYPDISALLIFNDSTGNYKEFYIGEMKKLLVAE